MVGSPVPGRGVAVQAALIQPLAAATGSETFFPAKYADSAGLIVFQGLGARLPGVWRLTWSTGSPQPSGCRGIYQDFEIPAPTQGNAALVTLTCTLYLSSSDSFDTEGNYVNTGGADKLMPDEALYADEWRASADGRFRLYYQSDGNLVLLNMAAGSVPLWSSGTAGTEPGNVLMQLDGNLVIYDAYGNAVWATNTVGNDGAALIVQSDGEVLLYREDQTVIWRTYTCCYYSP